jgi:hypothetical protein
MSDLDAFFTENGLYEQVVGDQEIADAVKEEDLKLVCYEILTME